MKKPNNTILIAGGVGAIALTAYLLWPKSANPSTPNAPEPAPTNPGSGGGTWGPDDPIKPPKPGLPTHTPPGATTPTTGVAPTLPPKPSAPSAPSAPSTPGVGNYVPGVDKPGGAKIDTNAPCSSGGMDYATLYRLGDLLRGQKAWAGSNPDAIRAQAQALSNTMFQYGLDACLALSSFPAGDPRLSNDCRQAAQQTAIAVSSLRSEFGAELPCPDAMFIDNWKNSALYQNNAAARACIDAAIGRCAGGANTVASTNKMAVSSGQERLRQFYDQLTRDDRVTDL